MKNVYVNIGCNNVMIFFYLYYFYSYNDSFFKKVLLYLVLDRKLTLKYLSYICVIRIS